MRKEFDVYSTEPNRSIIASIFLLVGFIMLGLIMGNILGMLVSLPLFGADYQTMMSAFLDPTSSPNSRKALLIVQAFSSLFGFILSPLIFWMFIEKRSLKSLFSDYAPEFILILLTGFMVMSFMATNSVIIEWNMNLDFGQLSPDFEEWASSKEDQLRELTEYLTRFESVGGLLVGLIVIAVFPAIGEEIVFRGIGQRMFHALTKNAHAGIWISAFLFSFIHLQFYGFFPRFLLGALFGYVYYWSGNLWYPIFAHFVNNGFTLVMLYLHQQDATDLDIEATDSVPWSYALLALVVTIGLLYYFRKRILQLSEANNE